MAKPKIVLDHGGIGAMLKSAEVRAALHEVAEAKAARARSSAPVNTGAYRDGIEIQSATTDRAVERVVATAPHSAVVEARTGNLKRAIQ